MSSVRFKGCRRTSPSYATVAALRELFDYSQRNGLVLADRPLRPIPALVDDARCHVQGPLTAAFDWTGTPYLGLLLQGNRPLLHTLHR